MTRRKNTSGTPRALDDVRSRRGSQQAASGISVGRGLGVDNAGRVEQTPGDEFFFDGKGQQKLRVDDETLEMTPGSPMSLRAKLADTSIQKTKKGLVARPTLEQVQNGDETLALTITRLQSNKENKAEKGVASGYASLDGTGKVPAAQLPVGVYADIDGNGLVRADELPIESGQDSLTAGAATEVTSNLMSLGYTVNVAAFLRSPTAGVTGTLYVDRSLDTATSFFVKSTSATEKCEFTWFAVVVP